MPEPRAAWANPWPWKEWNCSSKDHASTAARSAVPPEWTFGAARSTPGAALSKGRAGPATGALTMAAGRFVFISLTIRPSAPGCSARAGFRANVDAPITDGAVTTRRSNKAVGGGAAGSSSSELLEPP